MDRPSEPDGPARTEYDSSPKPPEVDNLSSEVDCEKNNVVQCPPAPETGPHGDSQAECENKEIGLRNPSSANLLPSSKLEDDSHVQTDDLTHETTPLHSFGHADVEPPQPDSEIAMDRNAQVYDTVSTEHNQQPKLDVNKSNQNEYPAIDELIQSFREQETAKDIQQNRPDNHIDAGDNEDEDSDSDAAAAAFQSKKEYFEQKELLGNFSFEDDIELRRLQKAEACRRRKSQDQKANDLEEILEQVNIENGLFVPEVEHETFKRPAAYSTNDPTYHESSDSDSEDRFPKPKRAKKSNEAQKMAKPKGGKKGNKSTIKPKPKPKKKKKTRAQIAQEQQENNLANINTLGGISVFHAAKTNHARADQPKLESARKHESFKDLIASIPEEERPLARTHKNQLDAAVKNFSGKRSVRTDPVSGLWELKGLTSRLEHYQVLGVSFMRKREVGNEDPKGGLVCDDMGFGKTVSCIANMVNDLLNLPKVYPLRTTLVVVPSSIVYQWMGEIKKHGGEALSRVIRYNPNTDSNDDIEYLRSFDVVVATYAHVQKSYPKKDPPVELQTAEEKKAWWTDYFHKNKGLLHSVNWRRVILDEANAIKNYQSLTSIACNELQADYRWAVSGTPATNSLQEFYAYLRFLKVPLTGTYRVFKKNFIGEGDGSKRLVAFIRPFMLRRTHQDSMFGAKLVNLPAPHRDTMMLHFRPFERDLYKIVHDRFVHRINGIAERGELHKSYSNILVLLLRLRQLAAHPLLIQDTIRDLLEIEDFEKIHKVLNSYVKSRGFQGQEGAIVALRRMLQNPYELPQLDRISPESSQTQSESYRVQEDSRLTATGGAFGMKDDFAAYIKQLKATKHLTEVRQRTMCAKCGKLPEDPHMVSCQHTYCWDCLVDLENKAAINSTDSAKCVICSKIYTGKTRYSMQELDSQNLANQSQPDDSNINKKNASYKANVQHAIGQWIDESGNMLPSAKTMAFKSQIMNYLEEDPNTKIVVYTQFMSLIYILAKICDIEKWGSLQLHGGMSQRARANSIKTFVNDHSKSVMLATLKTGGVGLNLVMATRVIMMDLWWNSATEEQAFCRTYRRGQNKETEMIRFMVHNTVDTQIQTMQERKELEISTVMSESGRYTRYSIPELLRLFGPLGEDEEGKQFVYVDDKTAQRGPGRVLHDGEDEDINMGDSP